MFETYLYSLLSFLLAYTANQSLVLRLTDNDRGVVEVFDGVSNWGTICGAHWGYSEAHVACRHMGYASAFTFFSETSQPGIDPFINRASCTATSTSFDQCTFSPWISFRGCFTPMAGVVCSGNIS